MTVYYTAGANNLIPIEIALKIANKIYANERFSAYIVVPMWPEGNPTGAPTQRILYWQVRLHSPSIVLISAVIYFLPTILHLLVMTTYQVQSPFFLIM
jgi:hypothetical protein